MWRRRAPGSRAVALKSIEIPQRDDLAKRSAEMGLYLLEQLNRLRNRHPIVGDVRGLGLLAGVEIIGDGETKKMLDKSLGVEGQIRGMLRARGAIARVKGSTISVEPPVNLSQENLDIGIEWLDQSLGEIEAGTSRASW